MSQQEVYDILKDGKWHSLRQLSSDIGKPLNTIYVNIGKICLVERARVVDGKCCYYVYRLRKRRRLL